MILCLYPFTWTLPSHEEIREKLNSGCANIFILLPSNTTYISKHRENYDIIIISRIDDKRLAQTSNRQVEL